MVHFASQILRSPRAGLQRTHGSTSARAQLFPPAGQTKSRLFQLLLAQRRYAELSNQEKGVHSLILPVPDLLEEVLHVDFLCLHVDHPRVLEHTPRRRPAVVVFLETVGKRR